MEAGAHAAGLFASCKLRPTLPGRLGSCSCNDVAQRFCPACQLISAALVAMVAAGCGRQDARLQQHQEKLESLGATTVAIAEAWLAGSTSGTYTRTALEQTFALVEQERTAVASAPQALLDPRGARLSEAADRLSRLLAVIMHDVASADADAVRRHMAAVPIVPADRR